MSRVYRGLALLIVALLLWALPAMVSGLGEGGPVQLALDLAALGGMLVFAPLFALYAIRGPETTERLLARLGIDNSRGARSGNPSP